MGLLRGLPGRPGTGAGVERLRFHLTGSGPESAPVLEMEAVDLVGNSRKIAWPLVLP
jgi:hypothetical protein